ncbi:ABC-2 type transporter [Tolumonas auensis DSM 9187]|uniref:ABC-2 type transporter n=1 Tax=Tolumonas auensis (strain DSM 9187 / NBRC 110442 / TA 4) TaxID=595494 RepID=C4L9B8_TOLAT|nr:ABC transporter permease [Tolumonas auensis]ACQ92017.1 ABC-2 type transporter [Tolumonas auensis DSM 9187]
MNQVLSWHRLLAMIVKEFIQLRRDRLTFAMMLGIPLIQLILFGFAINGDPKHLPTVIVAHEQTPFTRAIVQGLENSGYFQLVATDLGEAEADHWLEEGDAQFAVVIPAGFAKKLQRGERPQLLVAADATDPSATANAIGALQQLSQQWLQHELTGTLSALNGKAQPYEVVIQRRFNPEGLTQYNIVPGLMGVILTMTMIMMTALAVTREVERGTMENLLATPVRPLEVMLGKILPYVLIGFVQVAVILIVAELLFEVPFIGPGSWLLLGILVFIAANLSIGITISSVARNQTQAMQMTFFFFLPSMLLSGFMFPFRGMPFWAQQIGELLPLTHFIRLIRGIMLKGNGMAEMWPHLWPLLLFLFAMLLVGVLRFRKTLD